MILLTKNGIRGRNWEVKDVYETIEEAQTVADRLNYQMGTKSWKVEEMVTA